MSSSIKFLSRVKLGGSASIRYNNRVLNCFREYGGTLKPIRKLLFLVFSLHMFPGALNLRNLYISLIKTECFIIFHRRLDYFVLSERLMPAVCDSVIREKVLGSDHCPITLFLHL